MEKHKYVYNDWEYEISYIDESPIPIFNVEPNETINKPKTLSKYYSLNENNVLAFLNNEFYVSQPDQLNDLFDSSPNLISFKNRPFKDFIPVLNPDKIELAKHQFRTDKKIFLSNIKSHLYKGWITHIGTLCMTEDAIPEIKNKPNELMWAHYTDNEGFLIEFEYLKFSNLFMGPYPINYIQQLTKINLGKMDNNLGFFITSLIKKEIWKYENEHRFLCRPENGIGFKVSGSFDNSNLYSNLQSRFISYPKESIKKVTLGFAFYKNEIDRQNANYSDLKYDVLFTGKNSEHKIKLFNYLIENEIPVELMVFDKLTFELKAIPISIVKGIDSKYSIKELH